MARRFVRSAWRETLKPRHKEHLVFISGLPQVAESKRDEVTAWVLSILERFVCSPSLLLLTLSSHVSIVRGTFFLGIETAKKRTLPWCGVELRAGSTAQQLSEALTRAKHKVPQPLSASRGAPTKKDKGFQVQTYAQLEEANDPRVAALLRGVLWNEQTSAVTPKFLQAIRSVFVEYAGSVEVLLSSSSSFLLIISSGRS